MLQTHHMKVMQISSMNIWRGGEVHVFSLCRELMSMGVPVVLACRSHSPIEKKAKETNIPILNAPLKNAIDLKSARTLANYCRQNSINIIHAHNGRDYWMAGFAKCFYPSLKVIITRHILASLKTTLFHRWLYKKIDKVIAVSESVKNTITVLAPVKITVVYNGIDTQKYASAKPGTLRKELSLAATTKIVGMVGQINPSKGHMTFIESIPEILSQNTATAFIIAGGGDVSQLKKMNHNVHFLGQRSDIPAIMKDLDVFVMASLNEPFGLVTIESMAAGTPVVATNTGGTAEIITDGENGLLFPPKNSEKLAQAVGKILTDKNLAAKLQKNGMDTAQKYDVKEMATTIHRIYQDILNQA